MTTALAHDPSVRTKLAALLVASALALGVAAPALAESGVLWRVTSSRVHLTPRADAFELLIPAGRARGVSSNAIPIEPGADYVATARVDVDALLARGVFFRVALYRAADGTGRQRARFDSAFVRQDGAVLTVAFEAPAWARAAKLRILARPDAKSAVRTTIPTLTGIDRGPMVVLRPNE